MAAGNPFMSAQPPQEPIVKAGEDAITKLLQMATSSPQLLMGLSMAGAAREISQLTGLSRRKQGGVGKGPAQPSAAAMLGGNMGDLDRMIALQSMLGGAPQPPMGGQMPGPMPGGPPGMPPGMPGQGGMPMPGMPPGGLPPQYAGLV